MFANSSSALHHYFIYTLYTFHSLHLLNTASGVQTWCEVEAAMHFPVEQLLDDPNDTAVIGDLDAFIDYVESGLAWYDWRERQAADNQKEKHP